MATATQKTSAAVAVLALIAAGGGVANREAVIAAVAARCAPAAATVEKVRAEGAGKAITLDTRTARGKEDLLSILNRLCDPNAAGLGEVVTVVKNAAR